MQLGTRSEVKQLLKKGLITVNGELVKKPEIKIDPDKDRVYFDKRELKYETYVYYLLNKPAGLVSATEDKREKTVLDIFDKEDRRPDLFPVGRLDKNTVGLLLITNDGALSHKLLSPRHHVDKSYLVRVDKVIPPDTTEAFKNGLDIGDDKLTLPAKLEITDHLEGKEAIVTIHEGRFHQIKRMFQACGMEVIYLKRLSMGSLVLDENLPEGNYRRLTDKELSDLKK